MLAEFWGDNWWWEVPLLSWLLVGIVLKLIEIYRSYKLHRQMRRDDGLVTTSSTRPLPPTLNEEQVRLRDAIVTVAEGTTLSVEEVASAARSMAQVGMGMDQIIQNVSRIASNAPVWSEVSFESRVQNMLAEAVTRDLDNSFINGTPLQFSATTPPAHWDGVYERARRDRRCTQCKARSSKPLALIKVGETITQKGRKQIKFERLCADCRAKMNEPEPQKIRVIRMGQRKE